jgi:2-amino-4-hydroxy-6-hydroxymethyldihydropteridine diphosphokinase
MSDTAWLALGANLGDPKQQLLDAVQHLDDHPQITVTKRSTIIVSPPWGKTDQNDFHNMVIEVETALKPVELLMAGLAVEEQMGRQRKEVWGPRTIDIDIVAYGNFTIKTSRLTLPHPYAHTRDFVLDPLREIAPEKAEWVIAEATRPR